MAHEEKVIHGVLACWNGKRIVQGKRCGKDCVGEGFTPPRQRSVFAFAGGD